MCARACACAYVAHSKHVLWYPNSNALQIGHKLREVHLVATMLLREREGGSEGGS